MKNKFGLFALALVSILIVSLAFMPANDAKKVDATGTWTFSAPNAPYEYSKGEFVISKEKKKYSGYATFKGSDYKIQMVNLIVKRKKISFEFSLESETITIEAVIKGTTMAGTAFTSQGDLEITATKK